MKKDHDHNLKDVIQQLLKAYGWQGRVDGIELVNSWEKVVGGIIAKHTQDMRVKNRILYIRLDSSVIRNELMMERSKIVASLNKEVGKDVIDDIVFR